MLWKFETNSWEHHEGSGMFDLSVQDEIRWDPFGSHDQGNESRNGFVHQTVALVESSVSWKVSYVGVKFDTIGMVYGLLGLEGLREFFQKRGYRRFLVKNNLR
jgi:hypothetical protein